jgi:hypothetical protein
MSRTPYSFSLNLLTSSLSSLIRSVQQRAGWDIHSADGGRTMRCKYTCRSPLDYCIGDEKQGSQKVKPVNRATQPQTPTVRVVREVRLLER